jgi:predicted kinase
MEVPGERHVRAGSVRADLSGAKPSQSLCGAPVMIVLTGIQAAGKSTVARLLAQRFAHGVHVEADVLHHMIVSGGEWMVAPGEPNGDAAWQLHLRLKHMCLLGRSFFAAGFSVVLDDIILGDRWRQLRAELQDIPFSLVVLAPRLEVVVHQRDTGRAKRPLGEAWAAYLDRTLRETMAGVGLWIDTSDQAPAETVDQILQHLGLARAM